MEKIPDLLEKMKEFSTEMRNCGRTLTQMRDVIEQVIEQVDVELGVPAMISTTVKFKKMICSRETYFETLNSSGELLTYDTERDIEILKKYLRVKKKSLKR